MKDDPGLEILIIGLGQGILCGPLDVVALIACIDTRLCYLKSVHDLDGLELYES